MSATPRVPEAAAPRRPLKTRQRAWAQALARTLTRAGASPNAISLTSLVFGIAAGMCLAWTARVEGSARALFFLAAAACIQLRLLCNMLDGMVAVEGGKRTVYGEIFNDMPDRFADVAILVGAGYSIANYSWGHELGWLAATLAVITAYIRLLGGSMGVTQYFLGPMAKPHRMALLTAACLLSIFESYLGLGGKTIALALVIMVVGMLVTCVRRTMRIVMDLTQR
jgi:phosphatidylglycerophosphate synthase